MFRSALKQDPVISPIWGPKRIPDNICFDQHFQTYLKYFLVICSNLILELWPSLGHYRLSCDKLCRSIVLQALETQTSLSFCLEAIPAAGKAYIERKKGILTKALHRASQGSLL